MSQLEQLAKRVLETGGSEMGWVLREALRRVSEPEELRKLAEGFYAEPEVSVPTLERLLELTPEDLLVCVELGFVYFLMGEDGIEVKPDLRDWQKWSYPGNWINSSRASECDAMG